ncbi:MAG: Ig-like domain-containing protein [Neisseriaceae bacterium]|jgi:hypothetical protein
MKKFLLTLFSTSIMISLVACSGAGDSSSISNQNNGFSVTSIFPTPNSVIPVNQTFTFGFNNNLDGSSINGVMLYNTKTESNEAISCQLTGDTSMQCTSVNSLAFGTEYNVILTSNIKNKAQNPLNQQTIKYQTVTQPIIISASPESGNVTLSSVTFTYIFSESMDLNTLNSNKTPDNVTFTDQTAGVSVPISCQNTNNVTMICNAAESFLTLNHTYLLNLSQKIKSHESISILPTSYFYSATNYTQPTVVSASPESGNIGFNNLTYTYIFNESMSANTLNSSTTPNNVTFTDQVTGNKLPISCIGQSDNKTMICTLTESSLNIDHTYILRLSSKIHSLDNVSLIPITYTYSLKNYSYDWSVIYTLPETTATNLYSLQNINDTLYACANNGATAYVIQYVNGIVNNKSSNINGNCLISNNNNFYIAGNNASNNPLYKFNINDNTTTVVDPGSVNGQFSLQAAINNGTLFYTKKADNDKEYIKIYDGVNISSIDLPNSSWVYAYIQYYNGNIIVSGNSKIYSVQQGALRDITPPNLPSSYIGYYLLVSDNNLYTDAGNMLLKFNGTSWDKTSFGNVSYRILKINSQSVYYATNSTTHLIKYSLIDSTTRDITPPLLTDDRVFGMTFDSQGNIYVSTPQKIYKGTLQ